MLSIERGSPLALYHQLKQMLLERIARGEFRPGAGASLDEELRTGGLRPACRMLSARELEDFCGTYRGDRFSYRLSGPVSDAARAT